MLLNRDRADAIMDNHGLAAIVASVPVDVFYLSGWSTDATWGFGDVALAVLPRDHALEPAVITVEVNTGQAQQRDGTWMKVIRPYRRKVGIGPGGRPISAETDKDAAAIAGNHAEAIAAYLEELGLKDCAIGFDERGLGFDVAQRLGNRIEVREARDILRDIRMVKTPEELSNIRASTRKTEIGMMNAAEAIAAGATCAEAERVFWSTVPLLGGRPVFLLITPFRPGFGRLPKAAPLQRGDTITFDATAEFDHYTSDIGRTAIIGEPSAQQLASYNAIRTGWKNALGEFKAGLLSSDIEQKVVAHVRAAGNMEFTAASIHSVGLEHTDHPHPGNSIMPFRLVDGSVLSCDMPWSSPEIGRFHFEDLLYLDGDKVETINDTDSRIFACIDNRTVRVE